MCNIFEGKDWQAAQAARRFQRFLGGLASIFLGIALIALVDGLQALMRTGSNELALLPGQTITISGPIALKNPVSSDVRAEITPEDAPMSFSLDEFFTGYWFGNGMWRAKISAWPQAETGTYTLRVSFRGASALTAQDYILNIYANAEEMRAASRSFLKKYADVNPFDVASILGVVGIFIGVLTYIFGRRYIAILRRLKLFEVYSATNGKGGIWCLCPRKLAPPEGLEATIYDIHGQPVCTAVTEEWLKGKVLLTLVEGNLPEEGSLACFDPAKKSLQQDNTAGS